VRADGFALVAMFPRRHRDSDVHLERFVLLAQTKLFRVPLASTAIVMGSLSRLATAHQDIFVL
jgi:hypothetical protein